MDSIIISMHLKRIFFFWAILFYFLNLFGQQNSFSGQILICDDHYKNQPKERKDCLQDILGKVLKDSSSIVSDIYRRLGTIYKNWEINDTAIQYYILASEYGLRANSLLRVGSNYNQIGVIYSKLKEYSNALEYFKKAYSSYESEDISNEKRLTGMADAAGNVAETYFNLGNVAEMPGWLKKSFINRIKSQDTSNIGDNYRLNGLYYYKIKAYDSSLKFLTRAARIYSNNSDIEYLTSSLLTIGKVYYAANLYDSSILYFENSYHYSIIIGSTELQIESLNGLAKSLELIGDAGNALKYLKLEKHLNDSLVNNTNRQLNLDLLTKYDTESKSRQIELQAAALKTKNLWMAVISVVLLSVLIIAALWINNVANKRRLALKDAELQRSRVDELLQKHEVENVNSMLRGQDAERKRIAQELHDRLGSILATVKLHFSNVQDAISALQQQQTKSYTEANQLLDEACEEVRRISHDLYEGSLVKFGFKTALLQLIAAIEKANALRISFLDNNVGENHYKPYEKDLYRITQELLSNTLKYANARQVTIQFNLQPGKFVYTYEDDGKGFNPVELQAARGIGYKNIESRVGNTGGTWHVDSRPGHGMTLVIEIPVSDGNH